MSRLGDLGHDVFQKIESIFHDVISRAPEEREAVIKSVCRDDPTLRAPLEDLLRAFDGSDDYMEPLQATVEPPSLGERIGPYRIVDLIAEGGMGSVYRAVRADDQFEKEVAIKVVRSAIATEELRRCFLRERQVLADLEHPFITRLLDGGTTEDDSPYIVMEFVPGVSIDEFCDQRRLGPRERIELFLKVCSAVQYAHRNLVVHRDLKPSNVLVTEHGTPRLLDFGISKLLADRGEHTRSDGTIVDLHALTPQYASPEQVRGEQITTATDVYSLGVILYRLLTGRRPFALGELTPYEAQRIVCEVDPVPPSAEPHEGSEERFGIAPHALAKTLRGDLDRIVMKAMEKDPALRYPAVDSFAEDLRRYLDGRAVEATRRTVGYVFRRFVRRNRFAVVSAAIVFVALVGGTVVSTLSMVEESRARALAARQAERAELVSDFLHRMLSSAEPARVGHDVRVVDVLEQSTASLAADFESRPEIAAAIGLTIGSCYRALGMLDLAERHLVAAHHTLTQELGPDDPQTLKARNEVGLLRKNQGRATEAEKLFRGVYERQHDLLGPNDAATLTTLNNVASMLHENGDLDGAEAMYRTVLESQQRSATVPRRDVLRTLNNLALVLRERGRLDAAKELLEDAAAGYADLLGDEHHDTLTAVNNLAAVLFVQGDLEAAEPLFRRVYEGQLRSCGPEHPDTLTARHNLAVVLCDTGRVEDAVVHCTETYEIRRRVLGEAHMDTIQSLSNLALIARRRERLDESVSFGRRALELMEQSGRAAQWQAALIRADLGRALFASGRIEEAHALLDRAVRDLERTLGPEHWQTTAARADLEALPNTLPGPGSASDAAARRRNR